MNRRGRRRLPAAAIAALSLTTVLVACGSDEEGGIGYLTDATVSTYNTNTVDGYASGAIMGLARVLPGFSYLGPDGQVVMDRDIGTVSVVDGPSLTLKYTFSDHAVYSDGHPMTCDDLLLAATAMGGRAKGFDQATTAGYREIENVSCTPGEKEATVTFRRGRDYTAWRALFGPGVLLPAHVVGRIAGVPDVARAINDDKVSDIGKIAKAWNTGFDLKPGQDIGDDTFLASGPYRVTGFDEADGLVLKRNEKWWGQPAATDTVRVFTQETDTGKAVADGRVRVADTGDLALADRLMGRAADEAAGGPNRTAAKDRLPLSVTQLVFSDRGVLSDVNARKAFAACVPRDELARKYGANGVVWSLRTVSPSDPLGGALNAQYARRYPRADIARARSLMNQRAQGGAKMTVRVAHAGADPIAKAVITQIGESCASAGITVTDVDQPGTAPSDLGVNADVLLTNGPTGGAAAGTASGLPDAYQLFGGDPLNLPEFRNGQVTGALSDLAITVSDSARLPLYRTVETAAWDSMVSLPLYGTVRAREHTAGTTRVVPGRGYTGTGWNMDRWLYAG